MPHQNKTHCDQFMPQVTVGTYSIAGTILSPCCKLCFRGELILFLSWCSCSSLSPCRNPTEAGILTQGLSLHKYPSSGSLQLYFSARPVQDAEPTTSPSYPLTSQVVCQHILVLFPPNSPPLSKQLQPLYTIPVTHNTANLFILLSDDYI